VLLKEDASSSAAGDAKASAGAAAEKPKSEAKADAKAASASEAPKASSSAAAAADSDNPFKTSSKVRNSPPRSAPRRVMVGFGSDNMPSELRTDDDGKKPAESSKADKAADAKADAKTSAAPAAVAASDKHGDQSTVKDAVKAMPGQHEGGPPTPASHIGRPKAGYMPRGKVLLSTIPEHEELLFARLGASIRRYRCACVAQLALFCFCCSFWWSFGLPACRVG
jgi:hypothetical protein